MSLDVNKIMVITSEELNQIIEAVSLRLENKVEAVLRNLKRTTPPSDDSWLTLAQAASYLHVSPTTLCRLREEAKLKGNWIGKRWRIKKADLDKYLINPWIS